MTKTSASNRIQWDWYGTWVLDYLAAENGHDAYEIWEEAYLEAHPDLEYDGILDLIHNHYHQSTACIDESLVGLTACTLWQLSYPWRWLYSRCRAIAWLPKMLYWEHHPSRSGSGRKPRGWIELIFDDCPW